MVNEIIFYIIAAFAVLGVVDKIIGNRFGLGKKFEEGLMTIGSVSVAVVGMIVLAPVIAEWLKPVIVPIFQVFGADPAMFAGCVLANNMGGAPLAQAMALDENAGNLSGLIVGSMLGGTVAFHIPVALGVIEERDREYVAKGILAGVMTTPIGSLAGGLTAGYSIGMLLRNLIPILIFVGLIALGFWKFQRIMLKCFTLFGNGVTIVITLGLGAGILEVLTGVTLIPRMNSIYDGFRVAADCAIVLAGALPMVYVFTKLGKRLLGSLGKILGINEVSTAGMIATLGEGMMVYSMIKDMDKRGKVVNMAFIVSASAVFGDHLGFTAGYHPDMVLPVIVGKVVGGITAVTAALWIERREDDERIHTV